MLSLVLLPVIITVSVMLLLIHSVASSNVRHKLDTAAHKISKQVHDNLLPEKGNPFPKVLKKKLAKTHLLDRTNVITQKLQKTLSPSPKRKKRANRKK